MITTKTGNLLDATETIIAHQVNCFGAAGGLAAAVFDKYPSAEHDYMQRVNRSKPWQLLGMSQVTNTQRDGHIICNLFGQYQPGADYQPQALEQALGQLGRFARAVHMSVALPYKLSCGICGGDWNEVQKIIERSMNGVNCVIYRREGD